MHRFLPTLSFVLFTLSLNAQTDRPHPSAATIAEAPWWAQQMYSGQPNVHAVDSAFMIWRMENPAAKTWHTQFYKHWRRAIGSYVSPDGFWAPPTKEEAEANFRHWLEARETVARSASWENIGPFKTWREGEAQEVSWQVNVYCLDQSPSDPNVVYAGTENGAVFRSTDGGANWAVISDGLDIGGVRAVKVHPADPNTVYFGERHSVYKSTDGGASWVNIFNQSNLKTNDISINPANPDVVLLTTEKGLMRSIDGGQSWGQIFSQKCWDIEIKTDDANTVFLLKNNPGTKLCEFFKSTDMGATWVQITSGWIDPSLNSTSDNNDGGARLAVTSAAPNRLYAVLLGQYNDGVNDNNYLGVYRSDDAGESWTLPNANANGGPGGPYAGAHSCLVTFWFNDAQRYPNAGSEYNQGFYNLALDASDTNPNAFLVGFLNLFKSEDGGTTFERWGGYGGGPGWQHPDIQDIDINEGDIWVSSDGGINKYSGDFSSHESVAVGIAGSDFWGFDGGWNEDVMTGGRYHNGNTATIFGSYPAGEFIRLGGAEATTGYVHPAGGRRVMHSDISPKILPATVTGPTSGFSFSQYPNEGYAGNNENTSEIEPGPRCYNHLYMGSENSLLKSTGGGLSWTTLETFGADPTAIITGIEVSRSNPDVIYFVQNTGNSKLWKTTDGGQTFAVTTTPPGAVSGAFIALSPVDENKIWLAWNKGAANTTKVFESADGGTSWANLTTAALDGHHVEQLLNIGGTDDGLYLATNLGMFYRSDSEDDWTPAADGLPARSRANRLVPFYAKGKVRLATYGRGIWQSDFYETPTEIIVQPTVDKLVSYCARDTFYFDDYSMVNHDGASWSWTFDPAPQFISEAGIRNPKVVFGAAGTYTATMTLNGINKTLEVSVSDGCDADIYPGNALSLNGTSDHAVANGNLNLNSNTVTLAAWIKADPVQPDRSVVVFARGGTTVAGLGFSSGTRLSYHWDGSQWWWDPNVTVPPDVWTHIALVVTPDSATIYMNGVGVTNVVAHAPVAFDAPLLLGWDPNSNARRFRGLTDEVSVWDKALTQAEIRELMHLTLVPAVQPNLVSYYQFNEADGLVMDRVSVRHASLVASAGRTTSTGPFGGGVSARQTVDSDAVYTFGETGVSMKFPTGSFYPDGEVVVSRINLEPDQLPAALPHSEAYWVADNYGLNFFFDQPDYLRFDDYGDIPAGANPADYQLFQRGPFDDGDTWGGILDPGDDVTTGTDGSVTFSEGNGVEFLGQFVILNEATTATEWQEFQVALQANKTVRLYWTVQQTPEVSHFIIEKSRDGEAFEFFKKVNTGAGARSYAATDEQPFSGRSFYRLRQIDTNGRELYSAVRSVTIGALASEWVVFPNPSRAGAALEIKTTTPGAYRFRIFNTAGQVILEKKLSGNGSIGGLPAGVYGYEIASAERRVRGKLVVVE
jgi:photosystem II stability/assembly factor-like uncharacterized protein